MERTRGAILLQMQQKQLREREKLAQETRAPGGVRQSPRARAGPSPRAPAPARSQPDKVRQTFEERRAKAGLNKISPRQPIQQDTTRWKYLPFACNTETNTAEKKISKAHTSSSSPNIVKRQGVTKIGKFDAVSGSGDVSQTHEAGLALEVAPQSKGDISIPSKRIKPADETDNALNNNRNENKKKALTTKPLRQTKSLIKINAAKVMSPRIPKTPEGKTCEGCGRRFAPDRLPKHQGICKTGTKERTPFDALKHRLAGTDAEAFLKLSEGGCKEQTQNCWRQKHEELIQALHASRVVKTNAGRSDLSSSPAHPEYVPCPHCSRRFSPTSAERHIPKCAIFYANKSERLSPSDQM